MSLNLRTHFQQACNKRRIHIEQLRSTRNDENLNDTARRRLDNKITHERQQLDVLNDMWDVT
jgi:hypothetical protein